MPGAVALLIELGRWTLGFALLWRRRLLAAPADAAVGPDGGGAVSRLSVVIPARNEAGVIGSLLATLPAGAEVVVVDDASTDATAAEAAAAGALVHAPGPPAPGWTGKAWACAAGAECTSRPLLAFVDADVRFAPGGLGAVADAAESSAGMVSVQPHHLTVRLHERLSAFFNVVGMMGIGWFALVPTRQPAGAFGPVLVLPRALYDAAGGHGAVRGEILDDVALAGAVRRAGGTVDVRAGAGLVGFRMYPAGLGQLVEGWTKNMAAGAGATPAPVLLAIVAWLSGVITAAAAPALALAGRWSWGFAVVLYGAYAAQCAHLFRRVGRFGVLSSLLFPVPLTAFLVVFARSVVLTLGVGRVRWRGREIEVRRR